MSKDEIYVRYVSGTILEYDITSANASVLSDFKHITPETYEVLQESDKQLRVIIVGKLIRDEPKAGKILEKGLDDAILSFIKRNGLTTDSILERTKDSLFILGNDNIGTGMIGNCTTFTHRKTYTSMIEFNSCPGSKQLIKIYTRVDGLHCRGARFDVMHPLYDLLSDILENRINKRNKKYYAMYRDFIKQIKPMERPILSGCTNLHFVDIMNDIHD